MRAESDNERRAAIGASRTYPTRLLPAQARAPSAVAGIASPWPRKAAWSAAVAGALLLSGCGEHALGGKDCPAPTRKGLSGYCVPRWVSLKRDQVFARKGPGPDYLALWVYRARGLPVQVVAETTDWRRVCDPQGGAAWVHRSMIDGRRTVLTLGTAPLPLARAASADAAANGLINARAVAALDRCAGDWCKVKLAGLSGWLPAARLWGIVDAPQCR